MSQEDINQRLTDLVRDLSAKLTVEQAIVTALAGALAAKGVIDEGWLAPIRDARPSVQPVMQDAVRTAIEERLQALERALLRTNF